MNEPLNWSAVPPGLGLKACFIPALKRWASIDRPSGTGRTRLRGSQLAETVLDPGRLVVQHRQCEPVLVTGLSLADLCLGLLQLRLTQLDNGA
jgi:hypothetical protein